MSWTLDHVADLDGIREKLRPFYNEAGRLSDLERCPPQKVIRRMRWR